MSPWQASLRRALRAALRLAESSRALTAGRPSGPANAGKRRGLDAELVHRPAVVQVVAMRLPVSPGVRKGTPETKVSFFVVTIGLKDPEQMRDSGIGVVGVPRKKAEHGDVRCTGFL